LFAEGTWKNPKNQRKFFDEIIEKKGFDLSSNPEQIYTISSIDVMKKKVCCS
jgi:hypothetical protein